MQKLRFDQHMIRILLKSPEVQRFLLYQNYRSWCTTERIAMIELGLSHLEIKENIF